MRKSFRKSLLYLILTMLIMPTWLVTGMLNASHAKAASEPKNVTVVDEGDLVNHKNLVFTWPDAYFDTTIDHYEFWLSTQKNESRALDLDPATTAKYKSIGNVLTYTLTSDEAMMLIEGQSYYSKVKACDISANCAATFSSSWSDGIIFDITAPDLLSTAFQSKLNTGSYQDMVESAGAYVVDVNGITDDNYFVQFKNSSVNEQLKPGPVQLKLISSTVPDLTLNNYYDTRNAAGKLPSTPLDFYGYLKDALIGTKPFAYIQVQSDLTVKLLDAAKYDLMSYAGDMTIPGDYPTGTYTVSGEIEDLAGNKTTVTYKLKVSNPTAELAAYKTTKLGELATAFSSYSSTDYTSTNWTAITGFNTTGISAITGATDLAGVDTALLNAKTEMANVPIMPAAVITNESVKTVGTTSVVITWTTDHDATSRVIYDKVSHSIAGASYPNYGYAFSTIDNPSLTTMSHSVLISGLTPGTKYYYRTVSVGSPVAIGSEISFTTAGTAPVTAPTVQQPPVTTSIAPQSAQAQVTTPKVEQKVETPADDQGQIKGDETATEESEKINWTPWIVLFVLIILAGAATGGYFYWFAGEDEVKAVVKEPKKVESEKVVTSTKSKPSGQKPNKKSKRW